MIELKNLSGGYGNKAIVHDVSLTFPDGEITVIVGANGCGKSTLLNLCRGFLKPTAGGVSADGKSVTALPRIETARKIAMLPQSRTVPDITVGALVLHGRFPWLGYPRVYRAKDKSAAEQAMERVGIADKRDKLLSRLSGGERQKAYLAMLLAQNTPHILLDEPTVYLDIYFQLELFALMKELKKEGKCVVTVMHDLSAALEIADRIVVMKDGGVIERPFGEAVEQAFGVRLKSGTQFGFEKTVKTV